MFIVTGPLHFTHKRNYMHGSFVAFPDINFREASLQTIYAMEFPFKMTIAYPFNRDMQIRLFHVCPFK